VSASTEDCEFGDCGLDGFVEADCPEVRVLESSVQELCREIGVVAVEVTELDSIYLN